jgi:hypothetical protein
LLSIAQKRRVLYIETRSATFETRIEYAVPFLDWHQKMARLTVTIPDDLKARMREIEHSGVPLNFSKICSAALEIAINEAVSRKGETELDGLERIAARMRATRSAAVAEEKQLGINDGVSWGKLRADPHELNRLVAFMNSNKLETFYIKDPNDGFLPPTHVRLFYVINPAADGDWIAARNFWDDVRSLDPSTAYIKFNKSDAYTAGFIEGALSVWNAVRPLLPAIF